MINNIKHKLSYLLNQTRRINRNQALIACAIVFGLATLLYSAIFFWPKSVNYNFASDRTCFSNPTLLPRTVSTKQNTSYGVSYTPSLAVNNYPVFSKNTCVAVKTAPSEMKTEDIILTPLHIGFMGKSIKINTGSLPKLSVVTKDNGLVSTQEKLTLKLDQHDRTFSYQIKGNEITKPCGINNDQLSCDLSELNLAQSQTYTLAFERTLNNQNLGTVFETSVKTVDPIAVTGQSIAPGSTIYNSPNTIELITSKPVSTFSDYKLLKINSGQTTETAIDIKLGDNKLIVNLPAPLEREATYKLIIGKMISLDKGFLPKAYELEFKTSAGPKVTGANLATYGISPDKNIVINFDQELLSGQNFAQLAIIETTGVNLPFTAQLNGKSLTLNPTNSLPKCTSFTVRLAGVVKNLHGVESKSNWQFTSRTLCQEVFSIGSSLQSRSITAYKFGNGSSKVIYIGATHGDEAGSKYLLDSWVNELEANYPRIPAHRTVVIIPMVNPDGFASGSRTNSRNVDLNRNFPANSWKADVIMPGGNLVVNGGGTSSLSEPESKALSDYVIGQNPRLVLTYHSKGSLVVANEAGDSATLASLYGKSSGYSATSESQLGTTFNYDTTGAFENWLYDKHSIPTLLIELKTHTANEFSRNKDAMWSMANL